MSNPKEVVPAVDQNSIQRALLEKRIAELQVEFENGQKALKHLAAETKNVEETVLRIAGAIQILAEMLGTAGTNVAKAEPAPEKKAGRDRHKKVPPSPILPPNLGGDLVEGSSAA